MNTQSLTRKQELRIDSNGDYVNWAWTNILSGIKGDVLFKLTHFEAHMDGHIGHDADLLADVKKVYGECLDFLGVDLPSISYDHSAEAETIRKIYFEKSKHKDDLYVIDIRPLSYFEPVIYFESGSSSNSILDEMAICSGLLPQHEHWVKHGGDIGKSNLNSIFEYDHTYSNDRVVMSKTAATSLADSFLSHFQDPKYYSNSSVEDGCEVDPQQRPKRLKATSDTDFGVIVVDERSIGMIATVTNI